MNPLRLGNCVHCTFVSSLYYYSNNLQIYLLTHRWDPTTEDSKVDLGVIVVMRLSTLPRSPEIRCSLMSYTGGGDYPLQADTVSIF